MPLMRSETDAMTIIGGAVGVLLVVLGLVTLARTGIPAESLTEVTTSVGPFSRTPLMGIIEIIAGLLVIAASVSADGASLLTLGMIALVFGLVWIIEPGAFNAALGVGRETAILYLVVAAVCLTGGFLGRRAVVHERTTRLHA